MHEVATQADELETAERPGGAGGASVRATLCLDWGCEDFGLRAATELRGGEAAEMVCPHGRPRCSFP